jgi:tetratricopeptide (TPR) repeat protein
LAEWSIHLGQLEQAASAVTEMIRLAPLNPVPLATLGDLRSRQKRYVEAKQHLHRALELDPHYAYAGFALFDLHLEASELDEAAATLVALRMPPGNPFFTARDLQLSVQRGEREKALALLAELCSTDMESPWPLQAGFQAVIEAGWAAHADRCIEQWIDSPQANLHLGTVWVSRQCGLGHWHIWKRLETFCARGEIGRLAIVQFIDCLAKAALDARRRRDTLRLFKYRSLLKKFLRKHQSELNADDAAWGKVGYALIHFGQPEEAITWLNHWREDPKVEMWMLYNLALMLRNQHEESSAAEVVREALRLPVRDQTYAGLAVWAALEDALGGNIQSARAFLANITPLKLTDEQEVTVELTRAVLDLQEASPTSRPQISRRSFAACKTALQQRPAANTNAVRRSYRRCCRRMAKDAPSLWADWQYVLTYQREAGWAVAGILFLIVMAAVVEINGQLSPIVAVWITMTVVFSLRRGRYSR